MATRGFTTLRLAGALAGRQEHSVQIFLMADAVFCAKAGQKVPQGYYSVQLMLGKIMRNGQVVLCGTCMDARGMTESEMMEGAARSTLVQLADWTAQAEQVLVF